MLRSTHLIDREMFSKILSLSTEREHIKNCSNSCNGFEWYTFVNSYILIRDLISSAKPMHVINCETACIVTENYIYQSLSEPLSVVYVDEKMLLIL